jgi:hypothetical protein
MNISRALISRTLALVLIFALGDTTDALAEALNPACSAASVSTIHTGSVLYYIPTDFITFLDQSHPTLELLYPDLRAFKNSGKACGGGPNPKCWPLLINIRGNARTNPSHVVRSKIDEIQRNINRFSPTPCHSLGALCVYTIGPPSATVEYYTDPSHQHIFFHCLISPDRDMKWSVCVDDIFLEDGNIVEITFPRLGAERIDLLERDVATLMGRFRNGVNSACSKRKK